MLLNLTMKAKVIFKLILHVFVQTFTYDFEFKICLESLLSTISYIKQMTFIGQMKTINEPNMPKNFLQMEFQTDLHRMETNNSHHPVAQKTLIMTNLFVLIN